MTRRRVLMASNSSWNIYNFRAGLVRALIENDYDVMIAAPDDSYSSRLEGMGCRFIPLPMDNLGISPIRDSILMSRFWDIFRHERPDALLAYTIKPNIYGSLA